MAVDGSVKILFRRNLPGAGFNSSGVPSQGKVEVYGIFEITTASGYTTGGEPLKPADLKLNTIDFISFNVVSVNDAATAPTSAAFPGAIYNYAAQTVIVNSDLDQPTEAASGEAVVLRFHAVGDSSEITVAV